MTLQASKLACLRGGRELFRDLDIDLGAGEALWVQGENGSGKTSLLRLLCGLAEPAAGTVRWCGREIRRLREDFHRELLYVGHAAGLKGELTAFENLRFAAGMAGCERDDAAMHRALARVGLARAARQPAAQLSQGQRKRAALARLHLQPVPRLLILDEPFSALDRSAADQLNEALSGHLERGSTLVYTTHQPESFRAGRAQAVHLQASPAGRLQHSC